MRRSWLFWAASLVPLATAAAADEPAAKLEVVSPKDDGIIATGINGRGDVIGFEWVESQQHPGVVDQVPFYARDKKMTRLPILKGYTATFPAALSDDGTVVGRASKPAPLGVFVPLRNQAFLWDAERGIRGLGVLEGDTASFATGISRDGRRISGFSVGPDRVRACVWDRDGDGDAWKAAPLPHAGKLGSNTVPLSGGGRRAAGVDAGLPCLWTRADDGKWTSEPLGDAGANAVPRAVNDAGTVVGVRFDPDGRTHAIVWTRDNGAKAIPEPDGFVKSEAHAVNNRGQVVGMIDGPNGSDVGPRAFVFEGGRLRVIDEAGPAFATATAINDRGQVAGVLEKEEEPAKDEDKDKEPK